MNREYFPFTGSARLFDTGKRLNLLLSVLRLEDYLDFPASICILPCDRHLGGK